MAWNIRQRQASNTHVLISLKTALLIAKSTVKGLPDPGPVSAPLPGLFPAPVEQLEDQVRGRQAASPGAEHQPGPGEASAALQRWLANGQVRLPLP